MLRRLCGGRKFIIHFIICFLIFCWPCISIYLFLNINQLNALNFIISLFQVSTCFEHMCSKHVEAWNKLIIEFSVSSWLILRKKFIICVHFILLGLLNNRRWERLVMNHMWGKWGNHTFLWGKQYERTTWKISIRTKLKLF